LVASTGDLNFCIKMLAGTPSYASQVEQNLSWKSFSVGTKYCSAGGVIDSCA